MSRLAARYRLLVRVYPPGPRRDELLGTLLDCAPPERRWPRPGEALGLVVRGLRARLGRPVSSFIVLLAVLATLTGAVAGASAGSWLGWQAPPPLPSGDRADELGQTVFPGLTVWGGGDAKAFVRTGDGEGLQYGFADYWVEHTDATRAVEAYTVAARDRLTAAGWDVDARSGGAFVATRDGLVLSYWNDVWTGRPWYDSDGSAGFELSRAAPWWINALTLTGALLGALAGWLLTGWASRRTEDRPVVARTAGVFALFGLSLTAPLLLFSFGWSPAAPGRPWTETLHLGLQWVPRWAPIPVTWLAPLALVVAGFARPRRRTWVAAGAVLVALTSAVAVLGTRQDPVAAAAPCTLRPAEPPAEQPAAATRLSTVARVFVRQDTPAEQRNLITAAIGRVPATRAYNFEYDPTSAAYRDAYCAGAPLPAGVGPTLPYFFDIDLSSPGAVPGLTAEVAPMTGVVAVRHGLPRE
ncbi:hypothetical protein [Symbioplanes lichenis]|uniref:hypothetical protein n=1 Tax=Symbioplanes lichenis TaxID=1629072 RepID=UPI00273966DE|nr:hypothetical protein [Actinoplanes lichenis]